jgi:Zn-finger nucleic acid-binding protein
MQCPRGHGVLQAKKYEGIVVERCPQCSGRWFDHSELEQLEETEERDDDMRAGTIEWKTREGSLACPKCGAAMKAFDYRLYDLELDACPEQHGYWLDSGEEESVRDAVEDRVKEIEDAREAEVAWGAFLYKMRKPSWLDRVNRLLRG